MRFVVFSFLNLSHQPLNYGALAHTFTTDNEREPIGLDGILNGLDKLLTIHTLIGNGKLVRQIKHALQVVFDFHPPILSIFLSRWHEQGTVLHSLDEVSIQVSLVVVGLHVSYQAIRTPSSLLRLAGQAFERWLYATLIEQFTCLTTQPSLDLRAPDRIGQRDTGILWGNDGACPRPHPRREPKDQFPCLGTAMHAKARDSKER